MLSLFSQFVLRQAIKAPIYLLNPTVLQSDTASLPRFSVLHYLDIKQDNHFPTRDLSYLKDIPNNKKIPVYTITDLDTTAETSSIANKYAAMEVRKWHQANTRTFKETNLIEFPNKDTAVIAIYNYNLLKDLYRYKLSPISNYHRFRNITSTYWNYVKKAVSADKESVHFVVCTLPNNIPNYNILNVILKFPEAKYARVISDQQLLKIIDVYRWLVNSTRDSSTMKDITDEDSRRIVIEFKYKGYSAFLPLSTIRSICSESKLDADTKVPESKVQKLYVLMLLKMQDKVNTILNAQIEDTATDLIPTETDDLLADGGDNDDDISEAPALTAAVVNQTSGNGLLKPVEDASVGISGATAVNKAAVIDTANAAIDAGISRIDFTTLLDTQIEQFDADADETNRIYEESILNLEKEAEESPDTSIVITPDYSEENKAALLKNKTIEEVFSKHIDEAVRFKTLTASEIRSLKKVKEARASLKSPYSKTEQLDTYKVLTASDTVIPEEEVKLDIDNPLLDDTFKRDIIGAFDRKYLKSVLKKDIVACISKLEDSGLIIKDYTVEVDRSAMGNYEVHKLTISPLDAKDSTIYLRIPEIDSEGSYYAAGIKCKMRKQRTDHPIRKIGESKVALTSNYGKLFIYRTERKASDPYSYIISTLQNDYLEDQTFVTKIMPGSRKISHKTKMPNIYSYLSRNFSEVHTTNVTLLLDTDSATNHLDAKVVSDIESKRLFFCGYLPNKHIVVVDDNDVFYDYSNNLAPIGDIAVLLGLDSTKIPKAFSAIKILGDNIPLGACLGYYVGLSNLIALTNSKVKTLEPGARYKAVHNEVILKFDDAKLVIEPSGKDAELLFNGYLYYKDFIKQYSVTEFGRKEIYLNMFEFRDAGLMHIKELNLLEELFLDPITIDVLKEIKEPTEYLRLLLRANELLKDFAYPDINDPVYSRLRGHDRVPGLMYKALAESIRDYRFKNSRKGKIELDPYKVWNYITQDNSVKIVEDLNPIASLKEDETVTLSGADGFGRDAVPLMLRSFHENDMGLISEATVDSSDAGINTFLTPYAKLKGVRGLVDDGFAEAKENNAKIFSTSTLLAPASETEDIKRINFISIQNGHTIYSPGYTQPILRTTYEYLIPYKVGKLYCSTAKEDGVITGKTDKLITIKYQSGEAESCPLGAKYGRMEGSIYPHSLVTTLKLGDKVKKGNYISYNENFFEPDWLDSKRLILKFSKNVTVAFMMNNEVFEDSSAISADLSKEITTTTVKEKVFVIEFSKNLINIVPEGSNVTPNTILFTSVDENTDYNNLSGSSIEMLQSLAALSPKAKVNGTVVRYEVRYNGDISDMSPTVRRLVNRLDKESREETVGTEYEVEDNSVNLEYRSDGKNLSIDTLELKVFIKVTLNQGCGDKGVIANQMKTITSDVFTQSVTTTSGVKIDAMFSFNGVLGRVVNSPILMGTTNRLVKHVSKQIADAYFGS